MKSWKTTLSGIVAATGVGLRHGPEPFRPWADLVESAGLLALGWFAQDHAKGGMALVSAWKEKDKQAENQVKPK